MVLLLHKLKAKTVGPAPLLL